MQIPTEITSFCTTEVGEITHYTPASGGCINHGGKIDTPSGQYFLKWNKAQSLPGMFTAEAQGLKLLSQAQCIQIPQVMAIHEGSEYSAIIMEYISPAPKTNTYWTDLAHSMACLHKTTQTKYGLNHHNYIGSLPQYNDYTDNWVEFFIHSRIQPQVKLAYDNSKLNRSDLEKFKHLEKILPDHLTSEKPSLTHGDLWSGNLMTGPTGRPVLIDPAVAYTHREMELAFTHLFGGFDQEFYNVYQEIFPMETGYQNRFDIYNIYPLLVHVNLFGGSYYHQVMRVVDELVG